MPEDGDTNQKRRHWNGDVKFNSISIGLFTSNLGIQINRNWNVNQSNKRSDIESQQGRYKF